MKQLAVVISLSALILASCNKRPGMPGYVKKNAVQGEDGKGSGDPAPGETGDLGLATPGQDLVWKRYRAFEDGLVKGLSLDRGKLCQELGVHDCVEKVHLTVLGGNEPYRSAQYDRAQAPTVLTAVAVDRIVLTACQQRLDRDKAGSPVIFKHFALSGALPAAAAFDAQTSDLYRRLLARDPETEELKAAAQLMNDIKKPDQLALMLCFAIGSSAENLLL